MKQPFDFKELAERGKAEGLPLLEDTAEKLAKVVFEWAEESCLIHKNSLVKSLGIAAVTTLKPLVFEQIDKIDGVEG